MNDMDREEPLFEEFLAERMRDKGVTLKRLSEATGIAPGHLENMMHGNFEHMPSTPYFRGYVIRVGKVLDFNGEEWWEQLKKEDFVKNSGPTDALPKNRFIKKVVPKAAWIIGAAVIIIIIYLAFTLPHILGKPTLTISYPPTNPYTTGSSTITLGGTVENADALYLSSANASDTEEIAVGSDGSWQKTVLLQSGLNPFKISAKKLLGGETAVTEEIIYQSSAAGSASGTASSSATYPTVHFESSTPATGSYFN